jgi:hypothetical protein
MNIQLFKLFLVWLNELILSINQIIILIHTLKAINQDNIHQNIIKTRY